MAIFDKALPYILKNEGGFVLDNGGPTNFGITLSTAQRYGVGNEEELKNISMEKVAEIYRDGYWFCDGINNQRVATKVFDMAVNMGERTAILLLQSALSPNVVVRDGVYGPRTEAAVNEQPEDTLLDRLAHICEDHYQRIVAANPKLQIYLNGWINRARRLPEA